MFQKRKVQIKYHYLLLLLLPPFYDRWVTHWEFQLASSSNAFEAVLHDYGSLIWLIQPFPVAVVLGFYRPGRIGTTLVLGCLLSLHIGSLLYGSYVLGVPFFRWFGPHGTLYNAPVLISICASLWIWYLGASLGARLALRRMTLSPSA